MKLKPPAVALAIALAATFVSLALRPADAQNPSAPGTTTMPSAIDASSLVGKPAPDFTLPDQNHKMQSLSANKGKWVVLAFYPKDMTKG